MTEYWKAASAQCFKEHLASLFANRENGVYVKLPISELGYPVISEVEQEFFFHVRWNRIQTYPPIEKQTRWSDDWSAIIPYNPSEPPPPPSKSFALYEEIIRQGGGTIALGRGRRVLVGDKEAEKIVAAGDGFVDIKTANAKIIASVVAATSSWEPDTREKKHNHKSKNKTEGDTH